MNSDLNEENPETVWVEIEVYEDDDGLNCYCGLTEKEQLDRLVHAGGECSLRFLILDHVFWTRTDKESEWATEHRRVVELGKGRWTNYRGPMYFRADHVILVSPLHGGAELHRKYVNEK